MKKGLHDYAALNDVQYLSIIVTETAVYQLNQCIHSCLLVRTVSDDADVSAAYDTEGQNTQQALSVHPTLLLFDPDRGLELVSLLNEEGSGSCVQTYLILNCNIFYKHNQTLPSLRYKG